MRATFAAVVLGLLVSAAEAHTTIWSVHVSVSHIGVMESIAHSGLLDG